MSHHESKPLTREAVQAWLDAYVHAWKTLDVADIEALFTEDAEYRYHPYDEPEVGRDTIVSDWRNPGGDPNGRDEPGTWAAEYHPYAVDGNRAVAIGTSTYYTDATQTSVDKYYFNNWLLEFAPDGRCRSFTEYYMKRPKA